MKRILMLGILGFGLVGCTTTENFFELTATPFDDSGYWTGPYNNISIATLSINQNGIGVICQDYNGVAKVVSVKKVNDKLYSQDGSFWNINNLSRNSMELAYGLGGSYRLSKDNDMDNITSACREKLKAPMQIVE